MPIPPGIFHVLLVFVESETATHLVVSESLLGSNELPVSCIA